MKIKSQFTSYRDFKNLKTKKLFKKYNLNYDLNSLSIVMEIQDDLSYIEKTILKEIKLKVEANKLDEND